MDLHVFGRFLARRGWLVLGLAVLGAGAALAWGTSRPTVYEGTTRVSIRPKRTSDLGQSQALQAMIHSYMQDISTMEMAKTVAVQMGKPIAEAGALRAAIHVEVDPNLYEIQIKAHAPDPAAAERLSEQWALAFKDQRTAASRELDPNDRVVTEIRDVPSNTLFWPRRKVLALAGAVVGALLGVLLALTLEYLSNAVVRDGATAADLAGAPLLTVVPVPSGLRAGRGQATREVGRLSGHIARVGWPVLLFALLGAASALAFSLVQTPMYRARTRIAVEPARGSDWGQTQTIQETMRGYSADIATRRMADQVNEALQLDQSADAVLNMATVAPEPSAYEIQLDIRHPNQKTAEDISRTWAELFIQERNLANQDLDQNDRTLTRLRDVTTSELWAPKKAINLAAGAVLGALIGLGVVYGLWWLRSRRVQNADDARRATGRPVVGVVPRPAGHAPGKVSP